MALRPEHELVFRAIVGGARTESLSLISARTVEGRQRVVLCLLLTSPDKASPDKDAYMPLAVLSDSGSGELIRDLVWPILGCDLILEAREDEVDLHD
jgi:hypothetical protein